MFRNHFPIDMPNPSFIISYIATNKFPQHAILAVSKKDKDGKFYILNALALRVNEDDYCDSFCCGTNFAGRATYDGIYGFVHRDGSARALGEERFVSAMHFPASERQAKAMLIFMAKCYGRRLQFGVLKKNCHNLVVAALGQHGIYAGALANSTLPWTAEKKSIIEVAVLSDEFAKLNGVVTDKKHHTWRWQDVSLAAQSYDFDPKYEAIADAAPDFKSDDSHDLRILKKTVHLLREYVLGSHFWHPQRHYREVVRTALLKFKDTKPQVLSSLIQLVKNEINLFHTKNKDVPNTKGSLFKRMMYIECVLARELAPRTAPRSLAISMSESHTANCRR